MWLDTANSDMPVNLMERGPLGFGVLPALRDKVKTKFMSRFLAKLYADELKVSRGFANTAVAHSDASDRTMDTLNVAMPDLLAEYWITCIPEDQRPVVRVTFPKWARYAALTAYDTSGLPIASISGVEVANDPRSTVQGLTQYDVDLLARAEWTGATCLIFRVYRTAEVPITAPEELPRVRVVPKGATATAATEGDFMPNLPQECALANGQRMGDVFKAVVSSKLKPLKPEQRGSQLFLPGNVSGLFPNANATYVCAFLPPGKAGLRMSSTVPTASNWRPYYGVMAVDQATTETLSSLTDIELGEPCAEFTLFVFRDAAQAVAAGYDHSSPWHKLLLWGNAPTRPGIVVRYLHYFDGASGLTSEEVASARSEISALHSLDGTLGAIQTVRIRGVGRIQYFEAAPNENKQPNAERVALASSEAE